MVICERCGGASPEDFRFCPACGEPLAEAPRAARKVVTVLFCDVTGSTALGEEIDPEALRGVMNRYFEVIRATIERHGGTVEKFIGDAVMAVFGVPRVHEDDALRAVRAAAEIRERLPAVAREVGVELRFRTGVNTGPVFTGEGENVATGDAVNVAARLEQAARPGEIVLGPETMRLVRDAVEVEPLEPLTLKGKSQPLPAFRIVSVDPDAPGVARRLDAALVGRTLELPVLREAWQRSVSESACHLFTVLGMAGVGKSRLVAELLANTGPEATVLRGRCLHYGEGITFWPLVEALMPVGPAAEPVLERLSTGGAATPEELFWEVRRLLESLAAERSVILHVDDLQWAEPMLLDLLEHIAELSRDAPILLLCTARPELLDDRPGWGTDRDRATTLRLAPLAAADCEALLDQLGDGLAAEARARVVAASEGNPLFLEEMVALVRERGIVEVPSTIQALLAARLERLAVDDLEVLERGAVEGEVFHRLAVRALASARLAGEVESRLAGLVRRELIRPHRAVLRGDEAFRFRHLLIRDAAYNSLPKGTRADLHERFARWLEGTAVDLVDPGLVTGAAEHLHAAGRRANGRSDAAAARNLLERSLALAPEGSSLRARIGMDVAEQLIEAGELARAQELITAAEKVPETAALAAVNRLQWMISARPEGAIRAIESELPELLNELAKAGDERGIAKAHMVAYQRHWVASQATPAAEQVRLAAEHARRAGETGLRSRARGEYVATLIWGALRARTISEELDAIEADEPGPYVAAFLDFGRGEICRLEGRFNEGLDLTRHGLERLQALGMRTTEAACIHHLAVMQLSAGDPAAAAVSLRRSDAMLASSGERSFRSTTQAYLAHAYELLGDRDAARDATDLSDALGAPEDIVNYAITHAVRARLALAGGDVAATERWARSAVEYALQTDFVSVQVAAKLDLARVLSALGLTDEAVSETRAVLRLTEAKGDRPGTRSARVLLEQLGAGT